MRTYRNSYEIQRQQERDEQACQLCCYVFLLIIIILINCIVACVKCCCKKESQSSNSASGGWEKSDPNQYHQSQTPVPQPVQSQPSPMPAQPQAVQIVPVMAVPQGQAGGMPATVTAQNRIYQIPQKSNAEVTAAATKVLAADDYCYSDSDSDDDGYSAGYLTEEED